MSRRVVIIGGGAAGLCAAVTAASHGAEVTILEHTDRVGRKILQTGNGKCNYTNTDLNPKCYHAESDSFVMQLIDDFGFKETIKWFIDLGIDPYYWYGYVYPHSEQAKSVLSALTMACERAGVRIVYDAKVKSITRKDNLFQISGKNSDVTADAVIIATGSKAAPATGSDGSGYKLVSDLGLDVIEPLPALCALYCTEKSFFKEVSGVRVKGNVSLYVDGKLADSDRGEIQLTDYGISGIPVFQVSRTASRAIHEGKKVYAELDLVEWTKDDEPMDCRFTRLSYMTMTEFGVGIYNNKLWSAILKRAQISPDMKAVDMTADQKDKLINMLTHLRCDVTSTADFDKAQVCTGGVPTSELKAHTCECIKAPGVYLAGEIIDVDGICGGYNLQWAWTSGHQAGLAAAGAIDGGDKL